ncbi:ATP-binding cassette domain-containing protein [Gemella sp. GH3]|uniref:metal ABC transporter ATP-binding protein n=1 Tax=unclassified Gemella TaxID=2624949 RepID=UPI0015D019D5|nr:MULTISPECIES: ATP-binding cassette domain-containing protein [unclassified Gemella]MBF0713259.1 ATP-binding cassette domain-containing protein [Gemella sp. GH3.1]NYS50211.1 ATP-binding cassette domain-containing protein [Gemella sp. GH3]
MEKLEINNIKIKVGNKILQEDISFVAKEGEIIAIIGENGVGKTSLLKNIILELNNKQSEFLKIHTSNKKLGYVPQFRDFNDEVPLSVYDFLTLPLKQKIFPWLSKKEIIKLNNTMKTMKIEHLKNKRIGTLSGGERQRVYLAQALIIDPKIILLDEFTSNLDKKSEIDCMKLVTEITKNNKLITLCITHELSLIDKKYVDKILYLDKDNYTFIDIEEYKNHEQLFKLCKHCAGDKNIYV